MLKNNKNMKIGVFDSGLGGLIIAREIQNLMPQYDYVYLGDTKRVPYGDKSPSAVAKFTEEAVDYLFKKENCLLIIIACNTVSARALRKIQQTYLIQNFKGSLTPRRVLGVLIPTAEEVRKFKKIGIIGTTGTVKSNAFEIEIHKINPKAQVFQNPAPMLVPLIENGEHREAKLYLMEYLKPLIAKNIDSLILGCTHYPILKKEIRNILYKNTHPGQKGRVKIISQEKIIPKKLKTYLSKHKEIETLLSKRNQIKILTTNKTPEMHKLVKIWFGKEISPKLVKI